MSVARFIYEQIYCRYLAPGEAIIPERGPEFANKVSQCLHQSFGVNIRITSAGRPQGNGQAEAMVKKLKQRMKALMSEKCNNYTIIVSEFFLCDKHKFSIFEMNYFLILGI